MIRFVRFRVAIAAGILLASGAAAAPPAVTVGTGTTVALAGGTRLVLDCSLASSGTFAASPGSAVVVTGTGAPVLSGVPSFADLTMNLPGTAAIGNAVTVAGVLTLTSGRLSLAGHDLLATTIVGGSPTSYVQTPDTLGRLVRNVNSLLSTNFPVGASSYDPVSVSLGSGADLFRIAAVDGLPAGGIDPGAALTRAWAVSYSQAPGANGPVRYAVQWNAGEQGPQFDRSFTFPAGAWAWRYLAGAWVPQSGVRRSDNGPGVYPAIDTLVTPDPGLWTLAGVTNRVAVGPEAAPRALELAAVTPNPARGPASMRFGMPRAGRVTLALYSVQGQRVATLADGTREAGWYTIALDGRALPGGIYFARLEANGEARTRKWVVVR